MDIDQIRTHIDNLIKEKGKNYRSLSLSIGKTKLIYISLSTNVRRFGCLKNNAENLPCS